MIRPQMDGSDAAKYLLDSLYRGGVAETIVMPDEAIEYVDAYIEACAEEDNAKAKKQDASNHIKEILTEKEYDIFKRGRNAKSSSSAKNTDILTYRHDTGVEALIGYLYIDQDIERILEIMTYGLKKIEESKP